MNRAAVGRAGSPPLFSLNSERFRPLLAGRAES